MIQRLQQLKQFGPLLSRKALLCIALAIIVGIFWFAAEVFFIQVLQIFLVSIGMQFEGFNTGFQFLENQNNSPIYACGLLLGYGVFRFLLIYAKTFLSIFNQHLFIRENREKVFEIALNRAGEIPTDKLVAIFTEVLGQSGLVINQLSQLVVAVVCATLFMAYGFYLSWQEMLLALVMMAILVLPLFFINRRISTLGQTMVHQWESVSKSLLNGIKNNLLLKVYSLISTEVQTGRSLLKNFENTYRSYSKFNSLNAGLPILMGVIVISFVSYFSISEFGTASGVIIGFVYLFVRLAQTSSEAFTLMASYNMAMPSAVKLAEFYSQFNREFTINDAAGDRLEKIDHIEVSNLSFQYEATQSLIENFNLKVKKGDVLLIKGPSGSGKTTLLSLILGLLRPQSGSVSINGKNDIALSSWSDRIGYVGPNPYLIEGTLLDNLSYANKKVIDETVAWEVLKKAELSEDFIQRGITLQTEFNEESALSTGQRQRLAIARAWLRSPDVLILDEATANVDNDTENKIISAVAKLFSDKIVLVISHKDAFDSIATQTLITGDAALPTSH